MYVWYVLLNSTYLLTYLLSYGQKGDCVVQFLRLLVLAVLWPGAQSARDNHLLACNFAKYSPIRKIFYWQTQQ